MAVSNPFVSPFPGTSLWTLGLEDKQSNPWLKEKGTQLFPHNKHLCVFAMRHDCSVEVCTCTKKHICMWVHYKSHVWLFEGNLFRAAGSLV
ncbi:hypothetical protein EYF80_011605 [Liparis tanakae]|uniref:Uncharacterized protein n=1 Tax=Liparis tanakae TaxID=230148 RepID=A0A4Z2IJA7_9TELE|nr:hypothetical protein EYF80_011605 [Liparis tanakae]